jgi:SAM-dependent methyltransferase
MVKVLNRALQNLYFKDIEIYGDVIDLGSKSGKSSYYRYLVNKSKKITFCDYYYESENVIKIDLEKKFQIEDKKYDVVILNNTLEHLFDYRNCVSESYRILKDDGILIGVVPFLHKIHPDPDDYFRYSASALKKIFENAGFSVIKINILSIGPFTTSLSIVFPILKFIFLKIFLFTITYIIDSIIVKFKREVFSPKNYPLSIGFILKKEK